MIKCKNSCPTGQFDGCCFECDQLQDCEGKEFNCTDSPDNCGEAIFDEETGLMTFQEQQVAVIQKIADIVTQKKALEDQEKKLKDKLQEAMEKYGIKKFESDVLNITYVAASTTTSIDSTKLKKKYPVIAEECSKTSDRKAYVKVSVK